MNKGTEIVKRDKLISEIVRLMDQLRVMKESRPDSSATVDDLMKMFGMTK